MTHGARDLAKWIDHTLLRPEATESHFKSLYAEALEHKFFSVCVPPFWVAHAHKALAKSKVKVCTVIGFPFGYNNSDAKAYEASRSIDLGADEIDMVINISALKSANWKVVQKDIDAVVKSAQGKIVKVILETALLTDEEKVRAAKLAEAGGAHFVKTSTGFSSGGATLADIQLLRSSLSKKTLIKASGGIRDLDTALAMLKAGAARIGTNSSVAIVTGHGAQGDY